MSLKNKCADQGYDKELGLEQKLEEHFAATREEPTKPEIMTLRLEEAPLMSYKDSDNSSKGRTQINTADKAAAAISSEFRLSQSDKIMVSELEAKTTPKENTLKSSMKTSAPNSN